MKSKVKRPQEEYWRLLYELGDELLALQSLNDQSALIRREFIRILGDGTQVAICLLKEFKPLPHEGFSPNEDIRFINPADCAHQFRVSAEDGKQAVIMPLITPEGLVGEIDVELPAECQVDTSLEQFFQSAGSYLAKLFEISRLYRLNSWRKEQLALMRSVNSEIVKLREPQVLFARIAHLIQSTFQFFFVAIYTVDSDANRVTFQSSAGRQLDPEQLAELAGPGGIAFGDGLVGLCAQDRAEVFSPDVAIDTRFRKVGGLEESRSELCLPLVIGKRVLGVLEIISDQPGTMHENDIRVLRVLSDSVAVAVRNSDLFNHLLEQTWVSTMLLQVSEASQQHDSADDLAAAVARIIPLFTDVERCAIYLRENPAGEFILNTHYGFDRNDEPLLAMLPYSTEGLELFTRLLEEQEPQPFDQSVMKCGNSKKNRPAQVCGLVPVAVHRQVFGAILVDNLGRETTADSSEISTGSALMAVGRQTAMAVENLRLQEARENEAYVTAVLLQVAEMAATASDLQETMDSIINFLPLVVGVDTAFVYLLDAGKNRMHLGANLSYHWKSQLNRLPSSTRYFPKSGLGRMLEEDSPLFFQVSGQPIETWLNVEFRGRLNESARAMADEPLMIVMPLFTHEARYGLLFVLESERGFEYREKKVEIISGIARNLSMAIQNERLKKEMIDRERIRQEFLLAQDIQRTFLPEKLPAVQGWEINARWRPAMQVGGDFYDAFLLDENRVGLVIADVSDKGIPAALYMTVARTLIHSEAAEGDLPSAVLQRVNRALLLNSQRGLFVTCLYGILNTLTGDMVYTNAGHNRPIWLRTSRRDIAWLEKGGMPLGVSETLELQDQELQMKEKDQLVFYTDGVTEARAVDGTLFGEERLFNILNLFRNRHSSSLTELIDQKIMDFRGGAPVSDDLTLLVVCRQ